MYKTVKLVEWRTPLRWVWLLSLSQFPVSYLVGLTSVVLPTHSASPPDVPVGWRDPDVCLGSKYPPGRRRSGDLVDSFGDPKSQVYKRQILKWFIVSLSPEGTESSFRPPVLQIDRLFRHFLVHILYIYTVRILVLLETTSIVSFKSFTLPLTPWPFSLYEF